MYTTFNAHLGIDKEALANETIFISDQGIDGNFLLHHLIAHSLNTGTRVCVLGIAQTLTHYASTAHKLAVNLHKAIDNKQFVFIDALTLLFDGFTSCHADDSDDDDDADDDDDKSNNLFAISPVDPNFSLKALFSLIASQVVDEAPIMVIVDDLTALINIGVPVQHIANFVHYCKSLTHTKNVSFVHLAHHEDDPEYTLLQSWLRHYATMEIHARAMKTGFSRELSGELNILRRSAKHSSVMAKRLHFKLLDKDVRFFAPGTSSAVL